MAIDRIPIALTNQCTKGCWFCYNQSGPGKDTVWTADEVVSFVRDCADHGIRAVSFGGGEPLQHPDIFEILQRLEGRLFRSMTTNGLLLDRGMLEPLVAARPDKVHISIHFPRNLPEIQRVIRQVLALQAHGIRAGVNLLVSRSQLDAAHSAAAMLARAGLEATQVVYLPMRGQDTPSAEDVASIAGPSPFQSTTCLRSCGRSERFCSIGWDRRVAWCSYTASRRGLKELSFQGLLAALDGLELEYCGGATVPITLRGNQVTSSTAAPSPQTDPPAAAPAITGDYPAAHSMDTDWFATDADGHVAVLESREPGTVPKAFLRRFGHQYSYWDFLDVLIAADFAGLPFDVQDFIAGGPGKVYRGGGRYRDNPEPRDVPLIEREVSPGAEWGLDPPSVFSWLERLKLSLGLGIARRRPFPRTTDAVCWVRDDAAAKLVASFASNAAPLPLPVNGHLVLWLCDYPVQRLAELHRAGAVLSVMHEAYYPAAYRFGIYMYECNDYAAGPYQRIARPRLPIHIDQLPPAAREVCSVVQFPAVRFAQADRLQPAEHTPCEGGQGTWQDTQGNDHEFSDSQDSASAENPLT